MRRSAHRWFVAAAFVFVAALPLPEAAASDPARLAEAEAAIRAGKLEAALAILDQSLALDANDRVALQRSGQVLWSLARRDEAVARYDRLLALGPLPVADRRRHAEYLFWTSHHDRARVAYEEVLAETPQDVEARLGLARTLKALNKRAEARAEARRVLDADPRQVEALNLIGQTYQWTSDAVYAREWYLKALAVDPTNFAAGYGLSQLEARADPGGTRRRLAELMSRYPDNRWLRELDRSLGTHRPVASFGFEHVESDNVLIENWGLNLEQELSGGRQVEVLAAAVGSEYGVQPASRGEMQAASLRFETPAGPSRRLDLRLGLAHREDTLGATGETYAAEAGLAWGLGRPWQGRVSASRVPYSLGLRTLDEAVTLKDVGFSTGYTLRGGFSLTGRASFGEVTPGAGEGVSRWSAALGLNRSWQLAGVVPVRLGYEYGRTEHERSVQSLGYFGPEEYDSHALSGSVAGAIPPRARGRRLQFVLAGSFVRNHYGAVDDSSLSGSLTLVGHVGGGFQIVASGTRSDGSLDLGFPASVTTRLRIGLKWDPASR